MLENRVNFKQYVQAFLRVETYLKIIIQRLNLKLITSQFFQMVLVTKLCMVIQTRREYLMNALQFRDEELSDTAKLEANHFFPSLD